jgi:hypothetical protein
MPIGQAQQRIARHKSKGSARYGDIWRAPQIAKMGALQTLEDEGGAGATKALCAYIA